MEPLAGSCVYLFEYSKVPDRRRVADGHGKMLTTHVEGSRPRGFMRIR
jgi:hypothetical protein